MKLQRRRGLASNLTRFQRRAVVSRVMRNRGKLKYPFVVHRDGSWCRFTPRELTKIKADLTGALAEAEKLGLDLRPPREGGWTWPRICEWIEEGGP